MSLVAALLIIAQSTAPQLAQTSHAAEPSTATKTLPVAVPVRASARVLRPMRIVFSQEQATARQVANASVNGVQRKADASGTMWVEFN